MLTDSLGWDIGGANLKVAQMNSDGLIISAYQIPCPLWKGLDQLQFAIEIAKQKLNIASLNHYRHAVTMTAELVDVFDSRDHGVNSILRLLKQIIDSKQLWIFCGRDGLREIDQVHEAHFQVIASANWLATAMLIANTVPDALILDIGSTTTDIIAIENHQIVSSAISDYDRLLTDELVYTGVVRTPVMAISDHSYFQGNKVPLVAEYFSTMADVYRICEELPDNADLGETADGNDKSFEASIRRLARMIGLDQQSAPESEWLILAKNIRTNQLEKITCAVWRVLSTTKTNIPLIGAGVGRFLARQVAFQCELAYRDFTEFVVVNAEAKGANEIADYAPAAAVVSLLHNRKL